MKPNKEKAILNTLEGLKASKREIQAQHATLGVQISSLEGRISTLEAQLRDYVGRESEIPRTVMSSNFIDQNINLKVMAMDSSSVIFKMKRSNQLEKLMSAWCNHHSVARVDAKFLYEGRLLEPYRTPELLEMKDGDEIDAFWNASGGGSRDSASCGICVE